MNRKKFILTLLTITMAIYICHDFLPYHSHGTNHIIKGNPAKPTLHSPKNHDHECDGHKLCVICLLKEPGQFQSDHQKVDFSLMPRDLVIKEEKAKTPQNQKPFFVKNNHPRIKSKFKQQPHSLRAPPFMA